jgi:hypothetical protein
VKEALVNSGVINNRGAEADSALHQATPNHLVQSNECATTDEEDVSGVYGNQILIIRGLLFAFLGNMNNGTLLERQNKNKNNRS